MKICQDLPIQKYVVAFVFNLDYTKVALIRKNRPKWQAGLLNGIGGKIEAGETALESMVREFEEETTVKIPAKLWKNFGKFTGEWGEVECFVSYYSDLSKLNCPESETIEVHHINELHNENLAPNLSFLIPMALTKHILYSVIKTI